MFFFFQKEQSCAIYSRGGKCCFLIHRIFPESVGKHEMEEENAGIIIFVNEVIVILKLFRNSVYENAHIKKSF